MNILITGATGFLGRALCPLLRSKGHQLSCLGSRDCDLTLQDSLVSFNRTKFDQIYHLAAWTRPGDFSMKHSGEEWIINQQINTNMLSWWQKKQPQAKIICIGTSFSYAPDQKADEEHYLYGLPNENGFPYTMSKRMLYVGLVALHKQFNLKYLYCVPDTLYGPNYHTDAGRPMHFIFDLIRKIMQGKLYGKPVILWGDGNQTREIVFIDDFVKIMLELSTLCENDIVNIAPSEQFSVRHFAELICEKVGYDFNAIEFDTSRQVGPRSRCLITDKLKRLLPGISFTPLEVGLEKTIEWFKQEQEKLL